MEHKDVINIKVKAIKWWMRHKRESLAYGISLPWEGVEIIGGARYGKMYQKRIVDLIRVVFAETMKVQVWCEGNHVVLGMRGVTLVYEAREKEFVKIYEKYNDNL